MNDLLKLAVPFGGTGVASAKPIGDAVANIVNVQCAINPEIQDSVATLVQAGTYPVMGVIGLGLAILFRWLMTEANLPMPVAAPKE